MRVQERFRRDLLVTGVRRSPRNAVAGIPPAQGPTRRAGQTATGEVTVHSSGVDVNE